MSTTSPTTSSVARTSSFSPPRVTIACCKHTNKRIHYIASRFISMHKHETICMKPIQFSPVRYKNYSHMDENKDSSSYVIVNLTWMLVSIIYTLIRQHSFIIIENIWCMLYNIVESNRWLVPTQVGSSLWFSGSCHSTHLWDHLIEAGHDVSTFSFLKISKTARKKDDSTQHDAQVQLWQKKNISYYWSFLKPNGSKLTVLITANTAMLNDAYVVSGYCGILRDLNSISNPAEQCPCP